MSIYKGTDLVAGAVVIANVGDIIDSLYPVGSVYIGTTPTCPIAAIKGTWTLQSSGIVTSVNTNVPVKGNGKTLGLTDGTDNAGITSVVDWNGGDPGSNVLKPSQNDYGKNVGISTTIATYSRYGNNKLVGVTTDASKSGIVGTVTRTTLSVNIWERTA